VILIVQASTRADNRDIVEPWDLLIGTGLQECIHAFRALDGEIESQPCRTGLTAHPVVDLAASEETRDRLPLWLGSGRHWV
jgi:hypothetical protein